MHAFLKLVTGTLCSRILGFVRDVVFFAVLGSSLEASAFLIAFAIPNLFRRLCGEGALNSAFIPVFAQRYVKHPQSVNSFLNLFFTKFGVYLGISVLVIMYALAVLHHYIDNPKWSTVIYLTNAMLPYLWFICVAALLNGTLNVLNAFSWTAFSPVLLNLIMLLGLGFSHLFSTPLSQVTWLSVCVILGGFLQWFFPKLQLKQKGYPINQFVWGHDADLDRIRNLFLPCILGAAIFQINTMLGRFFAYTIDEHAVSFLYLSNRFLELPLGLFAFAIISILLPKLSLANAKNDVLGSKRLLHNGIHVLCLLLIPSAIGLYILADPLMHLCFCWGKFLKQDTQQVAMLLKIFVIGLPFFGLSSLFTRVFYAHNNTKTPVKLSFITLIFFITFTALFVDKCGVKSLALASVLSTGIQMYLQIYILRKTYPHYRLKYQPLPLASWACFLVFAFCVSFLFHLFPLQTTKLYATLSLTGFIFISLCIYFLALSIFNKKALHLLYAITFSKVAK